MNNTYQSTGDLLKRQKFHFFPKRFKLNVTAALRSETGIHFIGNHILYKRAYLPDQFWDGIASLNTKDNVVAIEVRKQLPTSFA